MEELLQVFDFFFVGIADSSGSTARIGSCKGVWIDWKCFEIICEMNLNELMFL